MKNLYYNNLYKKRISSRKVKAKRFFSSPFWRKDPNTVTVSSKLAKRLLKQALEAESAPSPSEYLYLAGHTITPKVLRELQAVSKAYPQYEFLCEGVRFKGNFSDCSFEGIHLHNADFSKATLTSANFAKTIIAGCDFSNLDLGQADFTDAEFHSDFPSTFSSVTFNGARFDRAKIKATFNDCSFKGVSFDGLRHSSVTYTNCTLTDHTTFNKADLHNSKFDRTCLENVHLDDATSSDLSVYESTMKGVTFARSSLNNSFFYKTNMENVDFSQTKTNKLTILKVQGHQVSFAQSSMKRIIMENTRITEGDFTASTLFSKLCSTRLTGLELNNCTFAQATLTNYTFDMCQFTNTSFEGAALNHITFDKYYYMDASQLSEISLIDPTFKGTVFQGSLNFSGAVITPFHLDYCDFSRASITDEPFSISIKLPSEWNADSLDRELNHFNNRASSSLLEKLHKLPDSLSLTKLSGFIQIIESLEDVPDADLPMHALLDILSHYQNDDEEIASFVKQRLYPRLLQESNLDIPTLPPHVLGGLLHYLAHSAPLDEFHADTYYLAIATAIESEDDQLVGLAERLEERYLDTLQDEDEEDGLLNTLEDCFDIDDIMIIRDGNQALVTFKEDVFPSLTTPGTPPILTRAATLSFDPESGWGFTPTITNMQERLRLSPLLRHTYTSQSMSAFRTSLMQTCFAKLDEDHKRQGDLDLSDLHTTLRERCEQAFQMSGIRDPRSKIIDPCSKEYQYLMALQDMMIATQSKTDVLLSPHAIDKLNKLFTSVGLHGKHAGMGFLLLGLMLTKLTSSYFWGTEGESPGPLRVIACACVSEAAKKGIISQEKFLDIKRRLQGEGNAFTCTAVVADKLQREAKDQFSTHRGYDHFYDTAKGMLPVAWGMSV